MDASSLRIERMLPSDWPEVREIYREGIETGDATFAEAPPDSWEKWTSTHLNHGSLVARNSADVLGWTALSAISSRCVYAGVAELSVYVAEKARGRGVGQRLMAGLIEDAEIHGTWTLQAGIFPENHGSLALHRHMGFREIGRRERIGRMTFGPSSGRWRDVLFLERRSTRIGID